MDDAFRVSVEATLQRLAAGDVAGALQQAQALSRSADAPFEKYTAGSLMLQASAAWSDLRAERIALGVMLESGAAPMSRLAEYRGEAGILSAFLGDKKDAVAQITYANNLGYATTASQIALADSLFQTGNADGANAAFEQALALRAKETKPIDPNWYDRAIALSYQAKRPDLLVKWTGAKLAAAPTPANWRTGIVNYINGASLAPDQSLDLYRLMAATDALASERDWQAYSAVATQSGTAAEAKAALDSGVKAGDLNAADPLVQKSLVALRPKAAKALAEVSALAAKAKTGSGPAALSAADAQFAAASYPSAAANYQLALSRGGVDKDRATTRLGIALARSGDLAGGKAMLAQVTAGPWVPVASLWSVWIDHQQVRNPA